MLIYWKYVSLLMWLSYALIASMLLFSRGFLLSRYIVQAKSECSADREKWSTIDNFEGDADTFYQPCAPSNFRAVILVIDALRFDFVQKSDTNSKIYHNKLTFVHEMMDRLKNKTRLYKFIADPPTTTMQRLHGLMTGSLPTFIDVGSNFASSELKEDNLISQILNSGKKVVFLGDDTWLNLFPNKFHRSFPFPSFNVWDLDTVDIGVTRHIFDEIQKDDWDLLIGHYLGVDHCGHRYGPNHPEMERKLKEMNMVIRTIVGHLDDRTFLFVFGDHGMTEYGDHGGATSDEINAALFIKSPYNLVEDSSDGTVRQIDLLPTLSTLLGVPIPFSNLGSLILDSLPSVSRENSLSANLRHLVPLMKRNINQATLYIMKYSSMKQDFSKRALDEMFNQYNVLRRLTSDEAYHLAFLKAAKLYLTRLREMCESIWAQFNYSAIVVALLLHISSIFVIFNISLKDGDDLEKKLNQNLSMAPVLCLVVSLILSVIVHCITDIEMDVTFYFFSITCSLLNLIFLSKWKGSCFFESKEKDSNFIGCFLFSLVIIGLFTNSYIMSENEVVSFVMNTFIWMTFLKIVRKKKKILENNLKGGSKFFLFKNYFLLFLSFILSLTIRGSHFFWQCYDENTGKCQIFKVSTIYSNVCAIIFFFYFRKYLLSLMEGLGVKFGNTIHSWFYKNIPSICFVLLTIRWLYGSLNTLRIVMPIPIWMINILPQVVSILSLIGIVLLFFFPLSAFFDKLSPIGGKCLAFKAKGREEGLKNLGTAFSSVFLLLTFMLSTLGVVLLGERRCLSCFMMFGSMGSLLILLSLLKVTNVTNQGQMFQVSWWEVAAWQISSLVSFYGTGHQPTFSALQWDSIVIFGDSVPLFFHGALVVMNTFYSQIVHSMLLPLLLFTPFTICHILLRNSSVDDGEFVLFKKKSLRRQMLFSLIIKSIVLLSLRAFAIMLSCAIHARHLMVWRIFAPKFVFEAVGLMISLPSLILGFILVERVCLQIEDLKKKHNFEVTLK